MDLKQTRPPIFSIVGPESTGKTTLSQQLAHQFNGSFIPEFAREFLEEQKGKYAQQDLITIANGQIELENRSLISAPRVIFCDTDIVVIMVWHEFKYGARSTVLESLYHSQPKRKYLLTYPDLPWVPDSLRENQNDLHQIFHLFETVLKRLNVRSEVVSGVGNSRLKNAIDALKRLDFG